MADEMGEKKIIQTYIEGGIEAVSREQNIIDTLATA